MLSESIFRNAMSPTAESAMIEPMSLIKLPSWAKHSNPVYRAEAARTINNRQLRSMQYGCLPFILGATGILIALVILLSASSFPYWRIENYITTVLGFSLLSMVVLQIAAGAALNIAAVAFAAPGISGEREQQSWSILRATALSMRDIVLGKWVGTLVQLRLPLIGLVVLRVITTVTAVLLLMFTVLRDVVYYWGERDWQLLLGEQIWIPVLSAGIILAVFYLLQPVMQFGISSALALLASTYSQASARSIALGMAFRLGTWLVAIVGNIGIAIGFGYLMSNWASPRFGPLEVLRGNPTPSAGLIWWVLASAIAIYGLTLMLSQFGLLGLSLGTAVKRAGRLID